MNTNNPHIGSSFDEFLDEEGMLEECIRRALEELDREQQSDDGQR